MQKSKVALVRCVSYDQQEVYNTVKKGLELIGGARAFVKPGERIVLKPNVLFGMDPLKCVTTHPSVLKAAGRLLQEAGASLYYGDSPGFGKSETHLQRAGLKQAADEMGIRLANFVDGRAVDHPQALLTKRFIIANGVLDSDGLVSLPKLKTHGLTRFTGAIKNQFGCIPGALKAQYHLNLADPYDFGTMLVDLNTCIRPRLFIMDGIMAMEGNGPRNGEPRRLELIMVSVDPVALDATACRVIYLNPAYVPTSLPGEISGLGTYDFNRIEIVGDELESFIARDFDVVRRPPVRATSGRIRNFLKNRVCPRPVIDKSKCTRCGICAAVCPLKPGAIDWLREDWERFPRHDYDRCIRCYCCQEMCPEGAISIKTPVLGNLMSL